MVKVKKHDKRAFQISILSLDLKCLNPCCNELATEGHHIIYKTKWSEEIQLRCGFARDTIYNGMGLCFKCHDYAHKGLGINKISGRLFVFNILTDLMDRNNYYKNRFLKVEFELRKSLIRKEIVK